MKRFFALLLTMAVCLTGCVGTKAPTTTTTALAPLSTSLTTVLPTTTTTAPAPTTSMTTITPVKGTLTVTPVPPPESDGFTLTDEQVKALDAQMAAYEGTFAVGYYDLTSGYTYLYNGTQSFPAASVIKAPYCRYVLELAEQRDLDLQATLTYHEGLLVGGTGSIQNAPFGTQYTHEQLIKLAIRQSDNVAFRMLRQVYPPAGFRQYAAAIGITDVAGIKNVSSSNLCAVDAITYMKDLYTYITGDNRYGKTLEEHMLRTINPMIRSKYPIVRKYGWMEGAYHDMAIIKAPRPYILVILSDRDEGGKEELQIFREISEAIEAVSGNSAR